MTRLVTDLEKSKKFPGTQLVPGTGRVDEICQHSDSGIAKVPGTWVRGRDLPAFRFRIAKVPGTGCRDEICQHSDPGIAKVPGTGWQPDTLANNSQDSGEYMLALAEMIQPAIGR